MIERLNTRLARRALLRPMLDAHERGFFHESYRQNLFGELGIPEEFVQESHSRPRRGIVRGMYFQVGRGAAKPVRCACGAILDVVVDLRRGSPTFGQSESFELNEDLLVRYETGG